MRPELAKRGCDADMMAVMRMSAAAIVGMMLIAAAPGATAQVLLPGAAPSSIPPMAPPPSPPPPVITVPVVPKLADPPPLTHERIQPAPEGPKAQLERRGHFSDRVARCLDEAAALGLGPTDRASYSRSCANQ